MERVDVAIVGAGVMGSAAARSLGARGVEAVLLEQFEVGHTRGSSHGPTRIYRLAYPQTDYVGLSQRALPLWRGLEEAAGERVLITTGGLDVGPMAKECAASLDACDVPYEWLSQQEATERFPGIDFEGLDPILYQHEAGVALADRTVGAQVRLARESGVEVRERNEVLAIEPRDGDVVVETVDGSIRARVGVVTAGSWAAHLIPRAGMDLPLTPILQQVSYFAPRGREAIPPLPTFIEWGWPEILGWYSVPPVGEAPGLKIGEHVGGIPVDPREGPFRPDPRRHRSLVEYATRRFPGLEPEPVVSETCLYTMTADEDFVLDRIGPLVIGAGFSGHGFKFAPLIGEILADLALGLDPQIPADRFGVGRAGLRRASDTKVT